MCTCSFGYVCDYHLEQAYRAEVAWQDELFKPVINQVTEKDLYQFWY